MTRDEIDPESELLAGPARLALLVLGALVGAAALPVLALIISFLTGPIPAVCIVVLPFVVAILCEPMRGFWPWFLLGTLVGVISSSAWMFWMIGRLDGALS